MELSRIFAKLMSIDSQMHNLQPKYEPTTTDHEPNLREESNQPPRPLIRDQRLLTLYKVMDMGA